MANRDQAIRQVKKRIVPVSESSPYCKVLVYGRNGKNKTRFSASGADTLIVDCNEKGTKSVMAYKDCYVFHAKRWADLTWVYWYLREGDHEHKIVTIDTATQMQKLCMMHVLKQADDRDPNRPPKTPKRQEWGQMTELMRPMVYDFRNLDMHVVFVCQERVDKSSEDEEESGEIRPRVVPDLSPGVRGDVMSACDFIGRIYKRPVRRGKGRREKIVWETRMLVGDHADYETKDRSGQLGYIVKNPTMDMFIEASKHVPEEDE